MAVALALNAGDVALTDRAAGAGRTWLYGRPAPELEALEACASAANRAASTGGTSAVVVRQGVATADSNADRRSIQWTWLRLSRDTTNRSSPRSATVTG